LSIFRAKLERNSPVRLAGLERTYFSKNLYFLVTRGLIMLSEALRLIRVFHDLSQKKLSEKLEISKSYISEIESGKKVPTLELLNRYSELFNIPISSIMFFSESIDSKENRKIERLRDTVSSKILLMLNFIAEKSGFSDEKG
jgi:transcriptional regulator with XRE-family HTH domain